MEARRDRESARMLGPPWLRTFLSQQYFTKCQAHGGRDRNLFCVDCTIGPLCCLGRAQEHKEHSTLQARKASHNLAVRTEELKRYVNVSQIQTYTNNFATIVFLNERTNGNGNGNGNSGYGHSATSAQIKVMDPLKLEREGKSACLNCGRVFSDVNCYFCSVSCKLSVAERQLQAIEASKKRNLDLSLTIGPPVQAASPDYYYTPSPSSETSSEDTPASAAASQPSSSALIKADAADSTAVQPSSSALAERLCATLPSGHSNELSSLLQSRYQLDLQLTEPILGQNTAGNSASSLVQADPHTILGSKNVGKSPISFQMPRMQHNQRAKVGRADLAPLSAEVDGAIDVADASLSLPVRGCPLIPPPPAEGKVTSNCCDRVIPVLEPAQGPEQRPAPVQEQRDVHSFRRPGRRRKGFPVRSPMF